jgi:hypothetical protein
MAVLINITQSQRGLKMTKCMSVNVLVFILFFFWQVMLWQRIFHTLIWMLELVKPNLMKKLFFQDSVLMSFGI